MGQLDVCSNRKKNRTDIYLHFFISLKYFSGMQRSVILEAEPWGLPPSLKILPQYLNSVGYESHMVGKWHLGFFEQKYTPTYRGFKSFFGFWQGHQDYFSHESHETVS